MRKLRVIALLGKAGAGKDTAGQMLVELSGGRGIQMAFADKLKDIAMEMFGLTQADCYTEAGKKRPTGFDCLMCPQCKSLEVQMVVLDRVPHAECKLCGSIGDKKVFASKWTPRSILQYLGTEGFRRIDPSVWVRYALNRAEAILSDDEVPFVVITDCRFRSEAQAVLAAGGEVWRIRRPAIDAPATGIQGHQSEAEQDSIKDSECTRVLENDSSLDVLRAQVSAAYAQFSRQ